MVCSLVARVMCIAGVIREVAEVRCGTEAKLNKAVSEGRVRLGTNTKGIEMFFFPTSTSGHTEESRTDQRMSRTKNISASTFEDFKSMIDNFGWTIGADQGSLEAPPHKLYHV